MALLFVVLLVGVASAAADGPWSVVVEDPLMDTDGVGTLPPGTPYCPATDVTRASMSFDGDSYIWEFTVANALAPCAGGGLPFTTRFPLYQKGGRIVGDASLERLAGGATFHYYGAHGGYQHWPTTFFEGNTARIEIPGDFGLTQEEAFMMSAFVDVSSVVVPCCVYHFRDDVRAP